MSTPSAKTDSIHVWQDNETDVDLLGFRVHVDLIRSVITNPHVLPVTVGVFGDWGGGKSSIMKMLQADLSNDEAYPKVVCIYFNGWTFEGYEDAKAALLTSILIQLGEHKRFGPKAKEWVVKLLKRVKWMEVGKLAIKHVGVPLATAALTGGVGAIPDAAAALTNSVALGSESKTDEDKHDTDEVDWSKLIEQDPAKADLMGVRKFRDEFSKMLEKTDIEALVVLIDDLDRCLPERLIETLEAIKLFVSVPRTAFVIGADPRIVKHAISTRYVKRQLQHSPLEQTTTTREEESSLINDYLEKLIQVPYQLPRLSPSEIETYINLLACQKFLGSEQLNSVLSAWTTTRLKNVFAACTNEVIQSALGGQNAIPEALKKQLDWSMTVSSVITDGLKGNPRQVKRMLNALSLRRQLADVARISIKDEVLAKLMVLEYSNLPRFQDLNQWQAAEEGVPARLRTLEEAATKENGLEEVAPETASSEWVESSVLSWLRMKPALADIDLREYFWLARDRTGSTLTGVTMIAPEVQAALQLLLSENAGENASGAKVIETFNEKNRVQVVSLLKQEAERRPDKKGPPTALHKLAIRKIPGTAEALIEVAKTVPPGKLRATVPQNIAELATNDPSLRASVLAVLTDVAKSSGTPAGKAASAALTTLAKKN